MTLKSLDPRLRGDDVAVSGAASGSCVP